MSLMIFRSDQTSDFIWAPHNWCICPSRVALEFPWNWRFSIKKYAIHLIIFAHKLQNNCNVWWIYVYIYYIVYIYIFIHTNIHPPHFQTQPATSHSAVIQHIQTSGRSLVDHGHFGGFQCRLPNSWLVYTGKWLVYTRKMHGFYMFIWKIQINMDDFGVPPF